MTIRRITVEFVGADGVVRSQATGAVDRRADLIRQARAGLERFRRAHARESAEGEEPAFQLIIRDAPAAAVWTPGV